MLVPHDCRPDRMSGVFSPTDRQYTVCITHCTLLRHLSTLLCGCLVFPSFGSPESDHCLLELWFRTIPPRLVCPAHKQNATLARVIVAASPDGDHRMQNLPDSSPCEGTRILYPTIRMRRQTGDRSQVEDAKHTILHSRDFL